MDEREWRNLDPKNLPSDILVERAYEIEIIDCYSRWKPITEEWQKSQCIVIDKKSKYRYRRPSGWEPKGCPRCWSDDKAKRKPVHWNCPCSSGGNPRPMFCNNPWHDEARPQDYSKPLNPWENEPKAQTHEEIDLVQIDHLSGEMSRLNPTHAGYTFELVNVMVESLHLLLHHLRQSANVPPENKA